MCLKIVHGHVDLKIEDFFSITNNELRGNGYKLYVKKPKTQRESNVFSFRVINVWNSLPRELVSSSKVNTFCDKLKSIDLTNFLKEHDF